jgi:AraC-like DNA-binding protein
VADDLTRKRQPGGLSVPVTIPVAFVNGMLSGIQARGETVAPFLDAAGIPEALLDDTAARVTATQYIALFQTLIEQRADEGLGFFSHRLKRGCFALIARSALNAPNLEQAILRISKTFALLQDDVELMLVKERELAGIALHFPKASAPPPVFVHEFMLRVFWRLTAWLAGGRLPAARVDLAFPPPSHSASYAVIFPGALRFQHPQTALWFDAAMLRETRHHGHEELRDFLAHAQANIILPSRGERITSGRVRGYLQQKQPDWPDLPAVSHALHMSQATLQRRLAFEGTAFQTLKDELRRDLAIARLSTSNVSMAQIAQELGFADNAAFQRAFKRWVGSAPGAYRKQKN